VVPPEELKIGGNLTSIFSVTPDIYYWHDEAIFAVFKDSHLVLLMSIRSL
jgi:hypothetical protein